MRFYPKLAVTLLVGTLVPVFIVALLGIVISRAELQESQLTKLDALAELQKDHVREIIERGSAVQEQEIIATVSGFTGLTRSAELLVAKRNAQGDAEFLHPVKFSPGQELLVVGKENLRVPITQALLGNETVFVDAVDYRNEPVLAATRFIPSADLGIVVKIDKAEAFEGVTTLYRSTAFVALFIALLSLLVALYLARSIAAPLSKLSEAVAAAEHKKTASILKPLLLRRDEIGALSQAFSRTMKALLDARTTLENKVIQRTSELEQTVRSFEEKNTQLERTQHALIKVTEDIRAEKKKSDVFAAELKKFKLAVDNATDHIVITDRSGKIVYANATASLLTGYTHDEIIGSTPALWGGNMSSDFYKQLWDTIGKQKESFSGELTNTRKNGERYVAQATISPIFDENEEIVFYVGIERDVTQERKIDKAKTEFVSLASHQLRTPLSTISWYTELLLSGDVGKITKKQKNYLEEIYTGSRRMVDLVNALLNASRLELGTLAVEPQDIDLCAILKKNIDEIEPLVKQKKHKLTVQLPQREFRYQGDPKLIDIIVDNLLTNAIKYTQVNGSISVKLLENKLGQPEIVIADNGMGIPPNQQDKLFTKLFRADNVKQTDTTGTGLGLYIVREILNTIGGGISWESSLNEGTSFSVTLPATGMKNIEGTKELTK